MRRFSSISALLFFFAAPAEAQEAFLLPIGGDADLVASHGDEARRVLERDLSEVGIELLAPDAVTSRAAAGGGTTCEDASCAHLVLRAAGLDLALGLALWRRAGGIQIAVVMIDPAGLQVSASGDGAATSIGPATTAALAQARARWSSRAGSPVRIYGTPSGASITVDREPWGALPREGLLTPGAHQVVVSAAGHETQRRDVEVVAGAEPLSLEFTLLARTGSGPDVGLLAVGSGLAAAGVGGALTAIIGATTHRCASDCDAAPSARTIERPAADAVIVYAVVGGAALVAGIVVVAVGASAGATSPVVSGQVRLRPDGLSVAF